MHHPGPSALGLQTAVTWDFPTLLKDGCRCRLSLVLYALLLLSYFSFPNDCIWGCLKNCLIYLLSAELGLVAVPSPGTASGRCSLAGEHRLLVAVVPCWRGHAGFSSRSCRVSCSTSRGVFPHKASDLCALHLQADS